MSLPTLVGRFCMQVGQLGLRPAAVLKNKQRTERIRLVNDLLRAVLGTDIQLETCKFIFKGLCVF